MYKTFPAALHLLTLSISTPQVPATSEDNTLIEYGHIGATDVTTGKPTTIRGSILDGLAGIIAGNNTAQAFDGVTPAFVITSIAEGDILTLL